MSHDSAKALREALGDIGDDNIVLGHASAIVDQDDLRAVLDELDQLRAAAAPVKVRGVDFACEQCGGLHGSELDDGWYRCKGCGYPGQ